MSFVGGFKQQHSIFKEICKNLCENEKNTHILSGYCPFNGVIGDFRAFILHHRDFSSKTIKNAM